MKIWALFSVKNDYNQSENNLVGWQQKRPTIEALASAMDVTFPNDCDSVTAGVVHIWAEGSHQSAINDHHYRLDEIEEGSLK